MEGQLHLQCTIGAVDCPISTLVSSKTRTNVQVLWFSLGGCFLRDGCKMKCLACLLFYLLLLLTPFPLLFT